MAGRVAMQAHYGRTGLVLLGCLAGPPAAFVVLSPLLALAGYTTGWFAPGAVGSGVGLVLLAALVVAVFVAAVVAVAAAVLTVIGMAAVTVGRAIAHIVSRLH